jgi:hypothetical protein
MSKYLATVAKVLEMARKVDKNASYVCTPDPDIEDRQGRIPPRREV